MGHLVLLHVHSRDLSQSLVKSGPTNPTHFGYCADPFALPKAVGKCIQYTSQVNTKVIVLLLS